jgi:hypothetical protein
MKSARRTRRAAPVEEVFILNADWKIILMSPAKHLIGT